MKKITFKIFFVCVLFTSLVSTGQCLTSVNGLYPAATFTPTCNSVDPNVIATNSWAGEFSNVNVIAGETYTFASSNPTDYITISTDDGATASTFGVTPITWTSDVTGVIRYYLHLSDQCGEDQVARVRTIACGTPPCVQPQVSFNKTFDCNTLTFEVTADITDLGSASTITVTDNQSSPSQSVSSTGIVTFGPYAFGLSVVLTATNDDTPICNVVSDAQSVTACPPTNDECADAVVINCGDVLTNQSTDGATGGTPTSCVGTIGDDIWYTFAGDGQAITLTATSTNGEGPQVEVYESTDGSCAGFTPGTCFASAGTGDVITAVTFVSEAGKTYYTHIGSWINGDPAVVFDLAVTCEAPPTPPANDDCSGAESLTINPDTSCTVVTPGTIAGATASGVDGAACGGTEDDDVWYSFVAENPSQIVSLNNVAGSTTDLYHSLWSGDCGTLTLVPNSCSDANTSTPSGLVIGQTYYLRVYSFGATPLQNSTFDVCIGTPPAAPVNDECDGAIALSVNPDDSCTSFESGTVQSATASPAETSCTGTEDDDVWYSFVATDVLQTIKLSNIVGLSTALGSSVWSGDCASLTLVPGSCSTSNLRTVTGLTAGDTYYVRVFTTTATTGQNTTFDICIGTPPPPPANDDCTAAIEITPGGTISSFPVVGSTVSATNTVGLPTLTCVPTNRSNDVWYSVVVPDSGSLTIETNPTTGTVMTDTVITIFSGTCGSLVEVGCDDDSSASGAFSLKALTGLTPGSTLYIGVWRYGTTLDGEFQISAYDASLLSNTTFDSDSFKSYPNPVIDILNLSYNKTITNVAVFNLLGQKVMTTASNANQTQIDMSHLSTGTYLVKVTADNEVKTIKVVKD